MTSPPRYKEEFIAFLNGRTGLLENVGKRGLSELFDDSVALGALDDFVYYSVLEMDSLLRLGCSRERQSFFDAVGGIDNNGTLLARGLAGKLARIGSQNVGFIRNPLLDPLALEKKDRLLFVGDTLDLALVEGKHIKNQVENTRARIEGIYFLFEQSPVRGALSRRLSRTLPFPVYCGLSLEEVQSEGKLEEILGKEQDEPCLQVPYYNFREFAGGVASYMKPIREIVEYLGTPGVVSRMEDAPQLVSALTGVSIKNIEGPLRIVPYSMARNILMWVYREVFNLSYPEIGRRMGNRDHTTVLYALRNMEGYLLEEIGERSFPLRGTDALRLRRLYHQGIGNRWQSQEKIGYQTGAIQWTGGELKIAINERVGTRDVTGDVRDHLYSCSREICDGFNAEISFRGGFVNIKPLTPESAVFARVYGNFLRTEK